MVLDNVMVQRGEGFQGFCVDGTGKPVRTTTAKFRPLVNKDHSKFRSTITSTESTCEQGPPVNYGQRPPKSAPKRK